MTLGNRFRRFVEAREKSLTGDIQQTPFIPDVLFVLVWHYRHGMVVNRNPRIPFQDFTAFESLMKRRNEKSAGLRSDTLE